MSDWESWAEYQQLVQPVFVKQGSYNGYLTLTLYEKMQNLNKYLWELDQHYDELKNLLPKRRSDFKKADLRKIRITVTGLVDSGERALLYHKRLAENEATRGFLYRHEIVKDEIWTSSPQDNHHLYEVLQLADDAKALLDGIYRLAESDDVFLMEKVSLPPELASDFKLARDLFSVNFDETGLLLASRGLEGVIRKIAVQRKLKLVYPPKSSLKSPSEVDLYDLIEFFGQLKWQATREAVITREEKSLMHFLRAVRNGIAHPSSLGARSPRETALLAASYASHLWKLLGTSKKRLQETTVNKTW